MVFKNSKTNSKNLTISDIDEIFLKSAKKERVIGNLIF